MRFGGLLPGSLSCSELGGAGLDGLVVPAPAEHSLVRVLGPAQGVIVGPSGLDEVEVGGPAQRVGPPAGAGLEIGQVPLRGCLLVSEAGELVGYIWRDSGAQLVPFGPHVGHGLVRSGPDR